MALGKYLMFGTLEPSGKMNHPLTHTLKGLYTGNLRGSKCPILEVSGSKTPHQLWILEPETSNIGYLDPLGTIVNVRGSGAVSYSGRSD